MTQKYWFIVTILTLITVIAWVIFDIVHTRSQVEMPAKWQEVVEPISPDFDLQGLQ
ncbi:hypothetical protein HYZ06_01380 [Candidatus Daviesbacteria bacterium]|nr:hypothetical protein [Candidatus Daviesbacteria bacterium]